MKGDDQENIPSPKLNETPNSTMNSIPSNSNNLSSNVFPCFTAEYERKCSTNNDLNIVPGFGDNYKSTIECNGQNTQIMDENTFHIGEESRKQTFGSSIELNYKQYCVNNANEGYRDSKSSDFEDMYIKQPIQETATNGNTSHV